jgi:hypothetical protein
MTRSAAITIGQFGRPTLSRDGRTMVVSIPISLRRQGGRKQVVTPADATPWTPRPSRVDSTIVKALVRAHRWRSMLESRTYSTVRDLATAENINESYLARVLRLTLLSPAIIEGLLSGQQTDLELADLLRPFPIEWDKQQASFEYPSMKPMSGGGKLRETQHPPHQA